nr:caspase family protein [Nitrospirota bacterium]
MRTIAGHSQQVVSVALSPDGRYVATGSFDKTAKLWDLHTGQELRSFKFKWAEGIENPVYAVAFSPDSRRLAIAGMGATRLVEIGSESVDTLQEGAGSVDVLDALAFSPDGSLLATGGMFGAKLWDPNGGRLLRALAAQANTPLGNWVSVLAFSSDGKLLATGSKDGTLRLWDVQSGSELRSFGRLDGTALGVRSLAFSENGHILVTGGKEGARLWDVGSGREIRALDPGETTSIIFVTFYQGDRVLTVNERNAVSVWDASMGQRMLAMTIGAPISISRSVQVSPDGKTFLIGPKLWDLTTVRMIRQFQEGYAAFYPNQIALSKDGRLLAFGGLGKITLKEIDSGREVGTLLGQGLVSAVVFSPDGRILVSSSGGSAIIWDLATGQPLRTLTGHKSAENITSMAWSSGGRSIVTVSGRMNGTAKLWDAATGQESQTMQFGESGSVTCVAFSPDSKLLAGGGRLVKTSAHNVRTSGMITLWNVATGKQVKSIEAHEGVIESLAFSPDGQLLASGSSDTQVKLWDVSSGKEIRVLKGHAGTVKSAVFSSDGRFLATAGDDGAMKLWNVQKGTEAVTVVAVGTDDYVIGTSDQYYLASKGGLKGVGFRLGAHGYPFEQFDLKFNRPDIVLARLGLASPQQIEPYKQAYQKRLKKMGFTEAMLGNDFHLPEVAVLTKDLPLSTDKKSLSLRVKATDDKYQLDRLNVFVNDVPIYGIAGLPLREKHLQTVEQDVLVPLAAGKNKIQVSVLNVQGAESLKETVYLTSTAQPASRDVYLLSVGVSQYQNPAYALQYAAKDAKDLASAYKTAFGGAKGQVFVKTLTDMQATKEEILKAKDWLKQSKVDDLVIVFVAGHGLTDQESNYYFGTYDVDANQPGLRGLPYDDLDTLLDGIPALQKLLLLDTCFSGEIDKSEPPAVVLQTASAQGQEKVKVRAIRDTRGVKLTTGMVKFQEDWFADLRRGTGAVVISSSSGDEYSLEDAQWQNGVFTYSVLKGLKEHAADANKDNTIRVSELQTYVSEQVKRLTNGGQNPTVRQENLENDFVVY